MERDSIYFSRRASEERDAATRAAHSMARQAHLKMAERYDDFAAATKTRRPEDLVGA
jgi:hypothetical protein